MTVEKGSPWPFVAWLIAVIAYIGDVVLLFVNAPHSESDFSAVWQAAEDLPFVIVATLSLVVLRAQPKNKVGWWLMVAGLSFPVEGFVVEFTIFGERAWGATGLVLLAGWVGRWIWIGSQVNIPFTLIYFPDGSLPTRGWRWATHYFWAVTFALFFVSAFDPAPIEEAGNLENPVGLSLLEGMGPLAGVIPVLLASMPAIAAVSLISRYRGSGVVVRQQVKLLAWVAAISVVFFAVLQYVDISRTAGAVATILYTLFVTTTIAAGIVRYRLFDIDRLISRTISYALVVALLGAVFFALVTGISSLVPPRSNLAVAVTTLAVAALFTPVRRRVQLSVDRRFNRSHLDAARVLDEFSKQLHDEIDVDRLANEWKGAVLAAMQPAAASVWIADR